MHILLVSVLTEGQKKDLEDLGADCLAAEPLSLSLPEDADRCLLLYDGPDLDGSRCPLPHDGPDLDGSRCPLPHDGPDLDGSRCPLPHDGPDQGGSRLAACLLLCETPDDVWECYAFTRPTCRRRGFFNALVAEVCRMAQEEEAALGRPIELAFLSDQKSPQGLAAARALGMELWYSEHQMERRIDGPGGPDRPDRPGGPDRPDRPDGLDRPDRSQEAGVLPEAGSLPAPRIKKAPRLLLSQERIQEYPDGPDGEPLESWLFSAYPPPAPPAAPPPDRTRSLRAQQKASPDSRPCPPQEAVGTCRLLPSGPSSFYLYHVEIRRELRSKGWGQALLEALFEELPKGSLLTLQVSSLNTPALALYKKTGFRITETLSYFIL